MHCVGVKSLVFVALHLVVPDGVGAVRHVVVGSSGALAATKRHAMLEVSRAGRAASRARGTAKASRSWPSAIWCRLRRFWAWRCGVVAAEKRLSACARVRLEVARALCSPNELVNLVMDFWPVRCHLVAAQANFRAIHVWEVTISTLSGANAAAKTELLNEIAFHSGVVDHIFWLPGSEILAAAACLLPGENSESFLGLVFWDVRSGKQLLRIPDCEYSAVSPGGERLAAIVPDGPISQALAIYRAVPGAAPQLERYLGKGMSRLRRSLNEVTFSMDGKTLATLGLSVGSPRDLWDIEVWDVFSGERLCSHELPILHEMRDRHIPLAFNGSTIAICQGSASSPGFVLHVAVRGGRCELVVDPVRAQCEDVSLRSGVTLHIGSNSAFVRRLGGDSDLPLTEADSHGSAAEEGAQATTAMSGLRRGFTLGALSPRGDHALVSSLSRSRFRGESRSIRRSFLWDFAAGLEAWSFPMRHRHPPVFSDDGTLMGVITGSTRITLMDLRGRVVQKLDVPESSELMEVAVSGSLAP